MIKPRDSYFDNAKLILIFLVVLGHCIEPIINVNGFMNGLFSFIYLFHMPAFIFIAGYYTKSTISKGILIRLVVDYLLLFIVVQLLFVGFTKMLGIQQYRFMTTMPAYIYWFIFAMFWWSILLKLLVKGFDSYGVRLEYLWGLSLLLGVIVGYWSRIGWEFSLSRIIVFFPFFIMGYYFKTQKLKVNKVFGNRWVAAGILLLGIAMAGRFNIYNFAWLSGANAYNNLGMSDPWIYRSMVYLTQTFMMFAFFALVPNKVFGFTSLGTKSLNIYLLHGFIVKLLVASGYYTNLNLVKVAILPLLALMIVVLLGIVPIKFQLSNWFRQWIDFS